MNTRTQRNIQNTHTHTHTHLLKFHARVKQDGKVAEFVGEFFADDGDGDADAGKDGLGEGGADRQTVDEVVQSIAEDDHPGYRGDVGAAAAGNIVRVAVVTVVMGVMVSLATNAVGRPNLHVLQFGKVGRHLKIYQRRARRGKGGDMNLSDQNEDIHNH